MQLTKEINGSIDRNSSIKEKFYHRTGVRDYEYRNKTGNYRNRYVSRRE